MDESEDRFLEPVIDDGMYRVEPPPIVSACFAYAQCEDDVHLADVSFKSPCCGVACLHGLDVRDDHVTGVKGYAGHAMAVRCPSCEKAIVIHIAPSEQRAIREVAESGGYGLKLSHKGKKLLQAKGKPW